MEPGDAQIWAHLLHLYITIRTIIKKIFVLHHLRNIREHFVVFYELARRLVGVERCLPPRISGNLA